MDDEPKFTPGPWMSKRALAPDNTGGSDYAIFAGIGQQQIIAEVFEHTGYDSNSNFIRQPVEANVRLIKAAPDLYAAAKAAWEVLMRNKMDHFEECDQLLEAIEKADGIETPEDEDTATNG